MKSESYLKGVFILSLLGTLFALLVCGTKLLTGGWLFDEPCPYLLGVPACWFGFAMYLLLFLASAVVLVKKYRGTASIKVKVVVSLFGIVFAGYYAFQDAKFWLSDPGIRHAMLLPKSFYSLVLFSVIFILSVMMLLSGRRVDEPVFSETAPGKSEF